MAHSEGRDTTIPIIDISNPSEQVACQVLEAASAHGFLFIKNDGTTIPPKDIDDMFELSKDFFASPASQKSEYAIHSPKAGGINRGWVSMQGEALDPEGTKRGDPKEAFNIAPPSRDVPLQPLPLPLSTSSDLISRFQTSCHKLCTNILSLLGTALQIPDPQYFSMRHDQSQGTSGSIFRMLYYPKTCTKPGEAREGASIRAGAHSDYGSVTLLFRLPGQAGLELQTADGWIPVPVNPDPSQNSSPPILVNIGDLLSFWTNGMLKSTVHRVTFSGGEERYSMAYFCHPLDEVKLDTVPSTVIGEFGEKGREELKGQKRRLGLSEEGDGEVLTAKQHLDRRLKVTYGL
ncbi:Clavaminate synthase-like protein [Dothidotthia symphoricarpi CBS 119687]|uniref:Clavaminate synthase-like protein n=1 Tax=Dothidotthia symphoricarpi CBS 119687 TaxID=1392245 RepID=A0A6A6A367_9PLEO|nr:Clavaminate synthase-like protein [Dothidotthia symphoricarpi CBS 119687]KAF2126462.1 Clavaminate synthase-like protein [Dothidotthia symphoricarpi CBS 119687]